MLYYEVKGEGRPLVLLHGYLENLKMWESIGKKLSEEYKLIRIDLPGHGRSRTYGETHTMEFMAEKAHEVLNHLGIEKSAMAGHSMGGYVTLAFAEKYPERLERFILLNSTSLPDSEEKKEQRLKAVQAAQENLDTLIKVSIPALFAEKKLEELKPEVEFAKRLAKETDPEGVTAALKGMRLRPDRTFVLQQARIPVGIVIGKYDQAVNPEELKKVIPGKPNITAVEFETGHMSHLEAPEHTYHFFCDFMEGLN